MATTAEILEQISDDVKEGVSTALVDGRSTSLVNPLDRLKAAQIVAAIEAVQTRGAWGSCLRGRAIPPGSV